MLPLRARVDLGAMTMKGYSTFPKTPALLEPYNQIVFRHNRTLIGESILPLLREAVGVFYSPSRLGHQLFLNVKTVLFQAIQFSISTQFSSI